MALFGCGNLSYINLREPIYLFPQKSFWAGCEYSPFGYKLCQSRRINQVYNGINEWFQYFDKANRPRVIMVFSVGSIPFNVKNKPIYLRIGESKCSGEAAACYHYRWWKELEIIFTSAQYIDTTMSHEFGHVLGRDDNDVPEGVVSVMSYNHSSKVTPSDFKMMCALHRECRMLVTASDLPYTDKQRQ